MPISGMPFPQEVFRCHSERTQVDRVKRKVELTAEEFFDMAEAMKKTVNLILLFFAGALKVRRT